MPRLSLAATEGTPLRCSEGGMGSPLLSTSLQRIMESDPPAGQSHDSCRSKDWISSTNVRAAATFLWLAQCFKSAMQAFRCSLYDERPTPSRGRSPRWFLLRPSNQKRHRPLLHDVNADTIATRAAAVSHRRRVSIVLRFNGWIFFVRAFFDHGLFPFMVIHPHGLLGPMVGLLNRR